MGKRTDSRDRTIAAAERLFRTRGVARTGLREVVAAAGTARGALGHHFPGGKEELIVAVLERNAGRIAGLLRAARDLDPPPVPADVVRAVVGVWREELRRTDFTLGCPLVATVVDDAVDHPDVRTAVTAALTSWEEPLATLLGGAGKPPAPGLALALLAAVEGAVVLARARRDLGALDEVERVFLGVLGC
ncbi:TetR/AcrR family transcriptional regulator [Crossiella cryophila]|uniref:AcrR family transcriptional regulator n=1 Tax=Crossiella cryophila TaxID=43355 RepID=A0A7W7CFU1_9PSEU|nr:TetR/AcrR family transcriptional regulator [Crossiella cryophila]MBB4678709.1 AcrR family transcriptional regulator [Crossiella cryophila]